MYWNDATSISVLAAHNRISFYTWGDCECCLPVGANCATLIDGWVDAPPPVDPTPPYPTSYPVADAPSARAASATAAYGNGYEPERPRKLQLKVGDILIFEEVIGPKTGQPADRDPSHRQAVRLTKVTPGIDPLYGGEDGTPVVEIEWASEDALRFPLCLSSQQPPPECGCLEDVSIARGNVILVDHGRRTEEVLGTVPTESSGAAVPEMLRAGDDGDHGGAVPASS